MKLLYAITVIFIMTSCNNHKMHEGESALKTEVLAIHDEAMEKMDVLMSLQMQLLKEKDSSNASQFEEAAKGLDEAYENMMDWMRHFSSLFPHAVLKGDQHDKHANHGGMGHAGQETSASMSPEDEAVVLEEEKKKVMILRYNMNERIKKAQALLGRGESKSPN